MPKNPLKTFTRRKSSGNALEDVAPRTTATSPSTSSFRVLERPGSTIQHRFGSDADARSNAKVSPPRPFNSPLESLRLGKSVDELGLYANRWTQDSDKPRPRSPQKQDRGSGGTTNSASSGYYDSSAASARHSSSSTLPSSVDADRDRDKEELFQHRKPKDTPMARSSHEHASAAASATPSLKSRAVRAFSFGQKQNRGPSQADAPPIPPLPLNAARQRSPERVPSPTRERALTASSYASTAAPPRRQDGAAVPNLQLGASNFGDEFGDIFANFGETKSSSASTPTAPAAPAFHRAVRATSADQRVDFSLTSLQESQPMFPPKALARNTPSPNPMTIRDDTGSPYSFDEGDSPEGLLNGSALESPSFDGSMAQASGIARAYLGESRGQYSAVPDQISPPLRGLARTPSEELSEQVGLMNGSQRAYGKQKQKQADAEDSWLRKVSLRDTKNRQPSVSDSPPPVPAHAPQPRAVVGASPSSARGSGQNGFSDSRNATPKANRLNMNEDSMFDSSPLGPPSRAIRPPTQSRPPLATTKTMTRAEFERLQKGGHSSQDQSEDEEEGPAEDEDEDEVELERAKQAAKQRRKQEASMAVYRQQMKKVTGGGPADLPSAVRPSLDRASNSAPPTTGLHFGGMGGAPPADALRGKATDDDDDDVPLGILQAHGFPSASRPPTRMAENELASQRRTSVAGSVVNGGAGQGNLPPFARRLPADPYYGASVVGQANRESLGFGGNNGSVYGGVGGAPQQSQGGHPAGLVGVIAGEERARAARRGSPNPTTGTYGPPPLPSNMPPQIPRAMSMGNLTAPMAYSPSGMPPMPQMPGMPPMLGMPPMPMPNGSDQQMQQFMQMQMQFMQNMIAMQQQAMGQPQPQGQQTSEFLGNGQMGHRPMSSMSSNGGLQVPGAQGRARTMMHPPAKWDLPQGPPRPSSGFPGSSTPSMYNVNMNGGGPGPGYTPSIAPSERSNIGMPSRYRPVSTMNGDQHTGRSQSMTSSMTMQAFQNQQGGIGGVRPLSQQDAPATIRVIDKPKGSPKLPSRPSHDDDDDEGWAEMSKKRSAKKFGWRKKDKAREEQQALSELYQGGLE